MKPNKKFYKRPTFLNTLLILLLALIIVPANPALTRRNAIDETIENMVGTWYFNNPLGDDEQMSIFENGSVMVWYSNSHIDKTWLKDSLIELKEYNTTVKTILNDKDTIIQFPGSKNTGFAKVWKRIDNNAATFLLITLTEQEKRYEYMKQTSEYINTEESARRLTADKYAKRVESAKKLDDLAQALMIYANDNEDKYPDDFQGFGPYDISPEQRLWYSKNLVYLGKGKTPYDKPTIVLAYDKTLLQTDEGTNVLFNNFHVEFVKAEELKELDIIIPQILIEARIFSMPADNNDINKFLNETVGTDKQPADTNSLILNDQQCEQLIELINTTPNTKMCANPKIMVYDSQSATFKVTTEVPYVCDVDENDLDPNGEPKPITDYMDIGTILNIAAELRENEKVLLDFMLEHSEITGYEEVKFRKKYSYENPTICKTAISSKAITLSGQTLLIKTKPIEDKQLLILIKAEDAGATPIQNPTAGMMGGFGGGGGMMGGYGGGMIGGGNPPSGIGGMMGGGNPPAGTNGIIVATPVVEN